MKEKFEDVHHDVTKSLCYINGIKYNPEWRRLELIISPSIFKPHSIFAGKLKEAVDAHNRVVKYFEKYPEKEAKFMEEGNYFDYLHAAEKEGIEP